ncbi:Hint domain-containing protein [Paracoccus laeviglucosivorans]|uniref:Hint domain-containing protein n=1 Tax=Paracoccus laeviglucosivorans TaxID=1197861 RepID=A0A521FVK9_9RHOB|nr:Hint domain-containing protein [Paracoccus laeviglucosivorans]SMO99580.1 Hint domain-containing protein [Paracoccus laeviglucosivorans]
MTTSLTDVAYFQGGGLISLGTDPNVSTSVTLSLVNLNALTTVTDGTDLLGRTTNTTVAGPVNSDGTPIAGDNVINVGQEFTLRTQASGGLGGTTDTTVKMTLTGTGTLTPLLGASKEVIIAVSDAGTRYVVFPDNDAIVGLDGITGLVGSTLTLSPRGYDLEAEAPLCFAAGTMLETPDGLRAIEDLVEGDLVTTKDSGAQPIRWMGRTILNCTKLALNENLRPIRIKAGSLGGGTPTSDLIVSPQHRVLVRSKIAQKMFGAAEVLVAAKQLLTIDGIDIAIDMEKVEYFHMLFDNHEIVISNGAETESLYTGPQALRSVGAAASEEIFAIFPELRNHDHKAKSARMLPSGHMGRKLAMRHRQHRRDLIG